jgi:N-acetylmuramoyl-L-alanine amidase/FG-GAP-like repeat
VLPDHPEAMSQAEHESMSRRPATWRGDRPRLRDRPRRPAARTASAVTGLALLGTSLVGLIAVPDATARAAGPSRPASLLEVPLRGLDPAGARLPGAGVVAPGVGAPGTSPSEKMPPSEPSGTARPGKRPGRPTAVTAELATPDGVAVVGVSWPGPALPGSARVQVRTDRGGRWSSWQDLGGGQEHGPDPAGPGAAEAAGARAGTDPFVVVDAQGVQVRTLDGEPEPGAKVSVVDPGVRVGGVAAASGNATASAAASSTAARPTIYSRRDWGADESLRHAPPQYGRVQAGFVHHTAGANSYDADQVPAIIRGIYVYHVQGRGWNDIGYNFLADRFGRIWEGRYGGTSAPVVGAHTLGYNSESFAMSAIGNFDVTSPPSAMISAYQRLFAWKLGVHGVPVTGRVTLFGTSFERISGHRDAGQTDCPGRYLYARLGDIRAGAAGLGVPRAAVTRSLDDGGTPDVLGRPTGSAAALAAPFIASPVASPVLSGSGWHRVDLVTLTADLTGDGNPDLVARDPGTGGLRVYPGDGHGRIGRYTLHGNGFDGARALVAPGDLDRDGRADLLAVMSSGHLRFFAGTGAGWVGGPREVGGDWRGVATVSAPGDLSGDGVPDLVGTRTVDGVMYRYDGTGRATLAPAVSLGTGWGVADLATGAGDLDGDGGPDLVVRERGTGRMRTYHGAAGALGHRLTWGSGFDAMRSVSGGSDLDRDGHRDLVGVRPDGRLALYRGTGHRELDVVQPSGAAPVGTDLAVVVGDLDADGRSDVLARQPTSGDLLLYPEPGTGPAAVAARRIGTGWGVMDLLAPAGDLSGDDVPDLLAREHATGRLWLYPMTATAAFGSRRLLAEGFGAMSDVVGVGGWDGYGPADLIARVAATGELRLYPGNGSGGLLAPRPLSWSSDSTAALVGAGDVDGDGVSELLTQRPDGHLLAWPPTSTGALGRPRTLVTSSGLAERRAS